MAASRIAQSGTANRRSTGSKVRNMIVIYKKNNIKKLQKYWEIHFNKKLI